jgi:hypothetical protein
LSKKILIVNAGLKAVGEKAAKLIKVTNLAFTQKIEKEAGLIITNPRLTKIVSR